MIRSLLAGAIDYAGLFPPAGLAMDDAAARYHTYLGGDDAWALGRFVVPASRLDALAAAALALPPDHEPSHLPWRLSALVTGDAAADMDAVLEFNHRRTALDSGGWAGAVDSVEARADSVDGIETLARSRHPAVDMFVEVAPVPGSAPLLEAIAAHRMAAKVRTGGVVATQFPTPVAVARFIHDCARLAIPFKATAGLHHPLRASYPLTYEADAGRARMFGFLNVLLASAAARAGAEVIELAQLLDESDAASLGFDGDTVQWRDRRFGREDVESTRARFALSFGSCSFEEPLADLRRLRLL